MPPLGYRPATPSDATGVAHVHRLSRAWYYGIEPDPGDGREAMWTRLLGEPGRITWVAERDGAVVAFVSMVRLHQPEPRMELTALYVLPDEAGAGIGAGMYELFEAERKAGEEAILEVWEENERAVAFYLQRGWLATSARRPGPRDAWFVTYRLPVRSSGKT